MTFLVEYDTQPKDFLRKLDKHLSKRIVEKIEEVLPITPVPHNAVSIVGEHGVFRVRVGDWRVIYRVNYPEQKVIIIKIDKRARAYN